MPKIVDRDQYRKQLLSKSFDLFACKGYSSITMRQIAESLGVSTGTLYHYFPNKKALFEQLIEEISQQDVLKATAELEGTETLQERMEALGRFLVKNEDYWIKWTCIWIDFYQHQDFKKMRFSSALKRTDKRYQQVTYSFLGIQNPVLASLVLSLVNGLILERLWGNEIVSLTEQCVLLGKMLTAYLKQ